MPKQAHPHRSLRNDPFLKLDAPALGSNASSSPAVRRSVGSSGWRAATAGMIILATALILLAMLASLVAIAWNFYGSDYIAPGVYATGLNLGGLTKSEASELLQDQWRRQVVSLTSSAGQWEVKADELGFQLDAKATAVEAHSQGRFPQTLLPLLARGAAIQPIWSFDSETAGATLERYEPQLYVAPVNAGFIIEDGEVQVSADVDGQALDVDGTLGKLAADPASILRQGKLDLITRPVEADATDVAGAVEQARALLSTTIDLYGYDPIMDEELLFEIGPSLWQTWLTLRYDPALTDPFSWETDEEAAVDFVEQLSLQAGEGRAFAADEIILLMRDTIATQGQRADARLFHDPRQHIVQAGESYASIGRDYGIPYPWVQQANPSTESLNVGDLITVPSPDDLLPFPVIKDKRIVVSISQQKAWVYENDKLKWEWLASTGLDDSPTATGVFQIQSHDQNAYASIWDLWMPSFMGIYRPAPQIDFMNGFHGFPTRNGSSLLWTGDLGRKVTYGCILLSSENAAVLYDWAEEGVVVEVRQ